MVTADEPERRLRFLREYTLRGEPAEAEAIYSSRMRDEWPWIEASAADAIRFEIPARRPTEIAK